jgi:murein DD-endopeptidase MepM/ murein hydrolase activator NlpD
LFILFCIDDIGAHHGHRQFRADDRFVPPVKYEEACVTQGLHEGNAIDIGSYSQKRIDVVAIADGDVLMTCRGVPDGVADTVCGFCGNFIEMKNAAGTIKYCHLTDGTLSVKKGDKVTKGQKLAQMGTSGKSTGVHLHVALTDNEGKGADFRKNCQLDGWKLCPVKRRIHRA